jgi:hypothetical protein
MIFHLITQVLIIEWNLPLPQLRLPHQQELHQLELPLPELTSNPS